MAEEGFKRKLAAILSADVEGYSQLMDDDEEATVRTLTAYRFAINDLVQQYRGRVVDTPGDNILAEFTSVVDAVNCAVEIQRELAERNAELPYNRKMEFRIGVNLGDVIEEEGRIYGDGVNIAARMEALAEAGGICISGRAYDQVANKLGLEYEDLGEHQVKNITAPIRVYRVLSFPGAAAHRVVRAKIAVRKKWRNLVIAARAIVVAVLILVVGLWLYQRQSARVEPASLEKMAYPLPDKPSIAVLPFNNLNKEPDQGYIADGISENIITILSNNPRLFVIARNSTFFYKNKAVKIREVSEELGVKYVLEGSALKSGNKLRVSAHLIDTLTGHHLWAKIYDRAMEDLFDIIDEITVSIATEILVELTHGEDWFVDRGKLPKNFEAWEYFMKAIEHLGIPTKELNAKARDLATRAVELEPDWSDAWALLSRIHFTDARYGLTESPDESFELALKANQKALELDESNPAVYTNLGHYSLLEKKYDKALSYCKKCVELAPSKAFYRYELGRTLYFIGRPEEAIVELKAAMRLNPHYPQGHLYGLGRAYYLARRYEEAEATFKKVLENIEKGANYSRKWPNLLLSAVYIELGRDEEARKCMQKVLEIDPNFNIETRRKQNLYKDPAVNERELDAHRKAGAPEHPPSK